MELSPALVRTKIKSSNEKPEFIQSKLSSLAELLIKLVSVNHLLKILLNKYVIQIFGRRLFGVGNYRLFSCEIRG